MEQERIRAAIAHILSGFYLQNRNPIIKKQLNNEFEFRNLLLNCITVRKNEPMLAIDHIWYQKFGLFYTPLITILPELLPALYLLPKNYHEEIMNNFQDCVKASVFVIEVIQNDWTLEEMKKHFNDLEEIKNAQDN